MPWGIGCDRRLWQDDAKHPSVYRSTHIDTDRDMNSFGNLPEKKTRVVMAYIVMAYIIMAYTVMAYIVWPT